MRRLALAALGALVLAGCGPGSGSGHGGGATLWVTRDRGGAVLHSGRVPAGESALQALDRIADVKTRFGGRYVREVDGLDEHGSRAWFYYVNGYLADRSAAEYRLRRGDVVWWDYRTWHDPLEDAVVVGSFPQPFLGGYDGHRRRTVIVSTRPGSVRALARRLHATVSAPGVGMVARDVNVIYASAGRTSARLEFAGTKAPGAAVKLTFRGDPRMLLRPRPFRYRYEVGG